MLRASGEVNGLEIDVEAALDRGFFGDCGVPGSAELLGFAAAVVSAAASGDRDGVQRARELLRARLGDDAVSEAAATVAAFCGLVRVADGTGIQLDDGVLAVSADLRARSGIDGFGGSANSDRATATGQRIEVELTDVAALFR